MMHVATHYHEVADDRAVPIAAILRNVGDWGYYTYDLGENICLSVGRWICNTAYCNSSACWPSEQELTVTILQVIRGSIA